MKKAFNPLMMSSTQELLGKYEQLNTKAAAFETANGESILVYYNPNCTFDLKKGGIHWLQPYMCANFVYDLNGQKAPNTVGKDIGFITVMYSDNPVVVAPMPLSANAGFGAQTTASTKCKEQDSDSRVPNINEVSSFFYNRKLLNISSGGVWSGTISGSEAWVVAAENGHRTLHPKNNTHIIRCIKR